MFNGLFGLGQDSSNRRVTESKPRSFEDYLDGIKGKFEDSEDNSFVPMAYQTVGATRLTGRLTDNVTYRDLIDVYSKHRQFIFVGLPGVGKSMVLREMFLKLADDYKEDNNRPLPLWISLSDPDNPQDADELFRYWCDVKYNLEERFDDMLDVRPPVLLLDGLNEMPLESRSERANSIKKWIERHRNEVRVIITCRVRDYQDDTNIHMGKYVPVIYVNPFERPEIQEFVYEAVPNRMDARRFMRQIDSDEAIYKLAQIPLHLSMLVQLSVWNKYNVMTRLPNRLKNLYEEYLQKRYDKEVELGKHLNLDWPKLHRKLEKLAHRMVIAKGEREGTIKEQEKRVRRILGKKALNDAYNLNLLVKSVALNGENKGAAIVEFFHPSLHGYFALPKLSRALDDTRNLRRLARIIRQIGDLGDTAEIAVDTLIGLLDHDHNEVQKASIGALKDIGNPAVWPLIRQLGNGNRTISENAVKVLGQIGEPAKGPLLIHALRNDDPVIRFQIGMALKEIPNCSSHLLNAFEERETNLRDFHGYIVEELGHIRTARAVQTIIGLLKDEDEVVRCDASWALGEIGDKTAVEPIINMLRKEEEAQVRVFAVDALKKIGGEAMISLIESINTEAYKRRRDNLGETLHIIFDTNQDLNYIVDAISHTKSKEAVLGLLALLSNDSHSVRCAATWILGELGIPTTTEPIINMVKTEKQSKVRQYVADALCKLGPGALIMLMEMLPRLDDAKRDNLGRVLLVIVNKDKERLKEIYKAVFSQPMDKKFVARVAQYYSTNQNNRRQV